jgi:hypothetical protein
MSEYAVGRGSGSYCQLCTGSGVSAMHQLCSGQGRERDHQRLREALLVPFGGPIL